MLRNSAEIKKPNKDIVTANQTKALRHITGSQVQSATFFAKERKKTTLLLFADLKHHLERAENEFTTPGV